MLAVNTRLRLRAAVHPCGRRTLQNALSKSFSTNQRLSSSMSNPSKMPLFMAYCPDYPTIVPQSDSDRAIKEDDTYAKRLSVRQEHWARAQVDRQAGRLYFGLGYLPPADSPITSHPARSALPSSSAAAPPPMAGSLLMMHYPTLQDMWDRIKSDVYWTAGVWDKEKTVVHEFIPAPAAAAKTATVQGPDGHATAGGDREPDKGAEDSQ